jgi:hypothetical protein
MSHTSYNYSEKTEQAVSLFRRYDVDTQLALLWFGYLDIKDQLNPAPPAPSDSMARIVYGEIKALPEDQQLQAQRDILKGAGQFGKSYSSLDNSARIEVWLLLGQGMESGEIINVPSDYQPPQETQEFSDYISQLNFEERIDFMRAIVQEMGAATRA